MLRNSGGLDPAASVHRAADVMARKPVSLIVAVVLGLFIVLSSANTPAAEPDWSTYDELLQQHVTPQSIDGLDYHGVDYEGLANDPRFGKLIEQLENFPLTALETREETLAYYINAYNIYALKMIVDHFPVGSIRDIGNIFRTVWKRDIGMLGGARVSLDEIEHERLRPLGDPRIHFAIVCASLSCPDLRTSAYRAGCTR